MPQHKSDIDRLGIPTGVEGEIVAVRNYNESDGYTSIVISEENRATVFEYWLNGVESLQKIANENYLNKGVPATVFGIPSAMRYRPYKYAVYVQPGFLVEIDEGEE